MNHDTQLSTNPPPLRSRIWLRWLLAVPCLMLGGLITLCLGILACAYLVSRIGGVRPEPVLVNLGVFWLMFGAGPLAAGVWILRPTPRTKRFWRRTLLSLMLLFVALGVDGSLGPKSWHNILRKEATPANNATKLTRTLISPHLDVEIKQGTNVLWCGTFQLAWNEVCALAGGKLRFNEDNSTITALNQQAFTRESLDEASYIALAGRVGDNIHLKIQDAIIEKYGDSMNPRLLPDRSLTRRPQDVVAYSCLVKNLRFEIPFERLSDSLTFAGAKVPAFGFVEHRILPDDVYRQVLILDYRSEDDFVIELRTQSAGDRLLLAKVTPESTLGATAASVLGRIAAASPKEAATDDILIVPRMRLELTRRFNEIEGLRLIPATTSLASDLYLLVAEQRIFFEMNERGVELKSEAHMSFGCARQEQPPVPHMLVFDKPFLVLMQRSGAQAPYFACWVDNPELLVAWK